MSEPAVRIFVRPLGAPLTIGMSGLTIASLIQSGLDLGWVPTSETADVGVILIAAPFVLQLLASVFSYLARDGATGAAIGVLATAWLALGLIHVVSPPGAVNSALGLLLLAASAVLALSSIAVAVTKPLPGVVLVAAAVRFLLAAIYELSAVAFWQDAAGILGLAITALAAYSVLAFELEGQRGGPALPTFRRSLPAPAALLPQADQIGELTREPGVRETA